MECRTLTQLIQLVKNSSDECFSRSVRGLGVAEKELLLLNLLSSGNRLSILVVSDFREVSVFQKFFKSFLHSTHVYLLPSIYSASLSTPDLQERLSTLTRLLGSHFSSSVILTDLFGLASITSDQKSWKNSLFKLKVQQKLTQESLLSALEERFYTLVDQCLIPGQVSVRGAVIDIYPYNYLYPIRLEYFIDTIISIKKINLITQLSSIEITHCYLSSPSENSWLRIELIENLQKIYKEISIKPDITENCHEIIESLKTYGSHPQLIQYLLKFRGKTMTTWEHLPKDCQLIFFDGYGEIFKQYKNKFNKTKSKDFFASIVTLQKWIKKTTTIDLDASVKANDTGIIDVKNLSSLDICHELLPRKNLLSFSEIRNFFSIIKERNIRIIILFEEDKKSMIELIEGFDINEYAFYQTILDKIHTGELPIKLVSLSKGRLSAPLYLKNERILILSSKYFIRSFRKKNTYTKKKLKASLASLKDLQLGDWVVHVEYGVGKYLGLKFLKIQDIETECAVVEYQYGDKIYIAVEYLPVLQRYQSKETTASVHVDSLRRPKWMQKKRKTEAHIFDIAEELIKQHAKRKTTLGHVYHLNNDLYDQFEAKFPYEETPDQLQTLMEIESDLTSQHSMDRVVCGDVGFGKTEIALRTAMRVVLEGMQVIVFAPTTLLTQQHFKTFYQRLQPFGVQVSVINRLRKSKNIAIEIKGFQNGTVDILIGTHRLLSKDIQPKNLGLVVIDEEHRLGVKQKEKLKAFKAYVDILTLTATPIPRTLHMATIGLRDISLITTPPKNRKPVKTLILPFSPSVFIEAIQKEYDRKGQVFFLHNCVKRLESIQVKIHKYLPKCRIAIIHGQMKEQQLEQVMMNFLLHQSDILLCTTIIEAGLDIPNVNTIIIDQAEHFGLAQLYQLRGRVGRSYRQAYAYFLTSPKKELTPLAKRRLDVLYHHQDLGSGFQIAHHDLEIRGAGNLVGKAQAGHIEAVGLELYTQMLEKAIKEQQTGIPHSLPDTVVIKIPWKPIIPRSYIDSEQERLNIYKSLFSSTTLEEIDYQMVSIRNRFGEFSEKLNKIFIFSRLYCILRKLYVKIFTRLDENTLRLDFIEKKTQTLYNIKSFSQKLTGYQFISQGILLIDTAGYTNKMNCIENVYLVIEKFYNDFNEFQGKSS